MFFAEKKNSVLQPAVRPFPLSAASNSAISHDEDILFHIIHLTMPYNHNRETLLEVVNVECKRHPVCMENIRNILARLGLEKVSAKIGTLVIHIYI